MEVEALLLKGASHRHPNRYCSSVTLDIIEQQDATMLVEDPIPHFKVSQTASQYVNTLWIC